MGTDFGLVTVIPDADSFQPRRSFPLSPVIDIIKTGEMIKLDIGLDIKNQVLPLGTAAAAFDDAFGNRVWQIGRSTFITGFSRFLRIFFILNHFCFCADLQFFRPEPGADLGRQCRFPGSQKRGFEQTGRIIVFQRHQSENIPEHNSGKDQLDKRGMPAAQPFGTDLPVRRHTGQRGGAGKECQHQQQDDRETGEIQMRQPRDQRTINQQEYTDEKDIKIIFGTASCDKYKRGNAEGFHHNQIGETVPDAPDRPADRATENETVDNSPCQGIHPPVRQINRGRKERYGSQESDRQSGMSVLQKRTRVCSHQQCGKKPVETAVRRS